MEEPDEKALKDLSSFIIEAIIIPLLAVFGIAGNFLINQVPIRHHNLLLLSLVKGHAVPCCSSLSGHYDCNVLRFSIVKNVNNFSRIANWGCLCLPLSLSLAFNLSFSWSGHVFDLDSRRKGFRLAAPLTRLCAVSPNPREQNFGPNFVSLGGF